MSPKKVNRKNQHGTSVDVINATIQKIPKTKRKDLSVRAKIAFENGYFTKETLHQERLKAIGLNEPIEFIQWLMFNVIKASEYHHIGDVIYDFYNDDALHQYRTLPRTIKNAYKAQYEATINAMHIGLTPVLLPPYDPLTTKLIHFKAYGCNNMLTGLLCGQLIYGTRNDIYFTRHSEQQPDIICVPSKVNNIPKTIKAKMDELKLTPLINTLKLNETLNTSNLPHENRLDDVELPVKNTQSAQVVPKIEPIAEPIANVREPKQSEQRYTFDEWLDIYQKMRKLIESEGHT